MAPPPPAPTPPPPPVYPLPIGSQRYHTGTLAKEATNPTIYFLMDNDGVKIPFANGKAFTGLGYSFADVQVLDLSAYRSAQSYFIDQPAIAHPWGSLTVWKDGTVYYMHPDGAIGVSSMEVLEENGLASVPIVPMNRADELEWDRNPTLPPLQINDSRLL